METVHVRTLTDLC